MQRTTSTAAPGRRTARRLAPMAAVTTLASVTFAGPALAQSAPLTVDAVKDSVVANGLPFGQTTLRVTRPDAITGNPVTIGQFTGFALPLLPFSVNTTAPSVLNPAGDCWQKGSLTLPGGLGLTPDIRGGDTVAVANGGPSLKVAANADLNDGNGPVGPLEGCKPLSAYGKNAVTEATAGDGADVTVKGVVQPLGTGVSLSATDGQQSTTPVDATVADGKWTATIPAADFAKLANGNVTLNAVYAVPDVATGDGAHVTGAPMSVAKQWTAAPVPAPAPAPAPAAPAPRRSIGKLTSISATKRVSLRHARRGGIRVAFVVPDGAKVVRVRLARSGKATTYLKFLAADPAGRRQVVRLTGKSFASKLRRGRYTLTVMAGPSRGDLGSPVRTGLTVR
jgi:hypothetical protein